MPFECDDSEWAPGGLTCGAVRSAVRPALTDVVGVTRLSATYQEDCPSGGSCPPAWGTVIVTAHAAAGEPAHLLVYIGNDGNVRVGPQPDLPAGP